MPSKQQTSVTLQELDKVPFIDLTVDPSDLFGTAKNAVLAIFSNWKAEDLDLVQCKDGITNKLVKITNKNMLGMEDSTVLIRAYGNKSEVIIDRNQELKNLLILSRNKLAPRLYGRFNNGIIYGYIEGSIYSVQDMKDPIKASLVANALAVWHHVELPGQEKKPMLWRTLGKWLNAVPESYQDPKIDSKFKSHFKKQDLLDEMEKLKNELSKTTSPTIFSHNDLLYANLIYTPIIESQVNEMNGFNTNGDNNISTQYQLLANPNSACKYGKVSFIDYEYASYSYRGFDIGNHFNEMAGFECDYSLYPSKEFQLEWLRQYLEANKRFETTNMDELKITDELVYDLYCEVNKYALASHFYWGTWALVQASLSDIDFDYMNYAVLRFNEYKNKKDEFLAL